MSSETINDIYVLLFEEPYVNISIYDNSLPSVLLIILHNWRLLLMKKMNPYTHERSLRKIIQKKEDHSVEQFFELYNLSFCITMSNLLVLDNPKPMELPDRLQNTKLAKKPILLRGRTLKQIVTCVCTPINSVLGWWRTLKEFHDCVRVALRQNSNSNICTKGSFYVLKNYTVLEDDLQVMYFKMQVTI